MTNSTNTYEARARKIDAVRLRWSFVPRSTRDLNMGPASIVTFPNGETTEVHFIKNVGGYATRAEGFVEWSQTCSWDAHTLAKAVARARQKLRLGYARKAGLLDSITPS